MARMTRNEIRNATRQANYNIMIQNGFTAKEARQSRDWSTQRTLDFVNQKNPAAKEHISERLHNIQRQAAAAKGIEYKGVSEVEKKYVSKYNYIISYQVKQYKTRERRYMTVTSETKLTKREVMDDFWSWFDGEDDGHYNTEQVIKGSVTVETCYVRGE